MTKDGKKGIVAEFAEFINRGNVMDMAVGVIIGGAFTAVVNALVTNVIQPLISFVTGGAPGVPGLSIDLNGSVIDFSAFISAVINFLITAAAVFAIVKAMNEVTASGTLPPRRRAWPRRPRRTPRPSRACARSASSRSPTTPRAARTARASSRATRTARSRRTGRRAATRESRRKTRARNYAGFDSKRPLAGTGESKPASLLPG